ncbi:MAG: IS1634 family transposase [Rhodobacteraceae bacterium]|nr:IS1634 family transposase [Paracoccaceae bacterium]
MSDKSLEVEYRTLQIGAASLVKAILDQLEVVKAIDEALEYQPEIESTYGELAQAIVINRMSFAPKPLYEMAAWASQHGIDQVLGIEAEWLDDDRLGAMLEGLAKHQVEIWSAVIGKAVAVFQPELEWLHADTTSVYFEGEYKERNGEPKQAEHGPLLVKGYNKDGKPKNVQYVLSLVTTKRLPLWYKPWDGNQSDDHIYLADLSTLRQMGWLPENVVMIGDRKLCNQENMLGFCRTKQFFLAAHPWTKTAKEVWQQTYQELQTGAQAWLPVAYTSRNQARKPVAERTQYRVCEVPQTLCDTENQKTYAVRWVFSWSSSKAERDAQKHQAALAAGEQALQRITRLLGRYDYTCRDIIQSRIAKALGKAKAAPFFNWTLEGTDDDQAWVLHWEICQKASAAAQQRHGVMLLCSNVPAERLTEEAAMVKYKEQVNVEQTIDFIKSPVQIRPMWLHLPQRLAGLTLLIMIAVLLAGLIEYQVRRHIAQTGALLTGLMPEKRDNPFPTAKKLLQAFQDYALVVVAYPDGHEEVHAPKLRPVQQQIWNIMQITSLPPPTLNPG